MDLPDVKEGVTAFVCAYVCRHTSFSLAGVKSPMHACVFVEGMCTRVWVFKALVCEHVCLRASTCTYFSSSLPNYLPISPVQEVKKGRRPELKLAFQKWGVCKEGWGSRLEGNQNIS